MAYAYILKVILPITFRNPGQRRVTGESKIAEKDSYLKIGMVVE